MIINSTKHPIASRFSVTFALCILLSVCLERSTDAQEVSTAVLQAQKERIAAIKKAKASAISIFARQGRGGGSGVVITPDGYALSNFHVVQPAGNTMKCSMNDGNLYDAVVVGVDPVGDVALIKLLGRDDFPTATMANSDDVKVGDWCFAVGNPFLLATDFQPTVTYGIVSGTHRYQYPAGTILEYADCIQTDASINPGNSGGPLFDANGDLIGINGRGSFEKRGRVNVGVGYAISINQIKHFMGYLRSGRILDHATLGASFTTDEDGRVVCSNILESSDAYRRGLRYGDQLLSFGGRVVTTVNEFKNVLGIFPRGWRAPVSFIHDGERVDTYIRLDGVHTPEELLAKIAPASQPMPPERPEGEPMPDKPPMPSQANPHQNSQIPAHLAKYFKQRRGFANYYFNELRRTEIWNRLNNHYKLEGISGTWDIAAKIDQLGDVVMNLSEDRISADLPQGKAVADLTQDFDTQLAPRGSGGMLLALHLWKQFLTLGPGNFGDVYYLGSVRLPDQDKHVDCLVGTHNIVECRFYFEKEHGHLIAMEMYPDFGVDPCEIYFHDFRTSGDRTLPHKIRIVHGDLEYGVLAIDGYTLPSASEK